MKTLRKPDKTRQKKRFKCSAQKAKRLVETYRNTGGSLTDLAKAAKVSRPRMYEIFEEYPKIREEIDSLDAARIEGLKDKALAKLEENIEANVQRAIEYALEKEPRKERGKIVVNRDDSKAEEIELYIGVRQKVIIE